MKKIIFLSFALLILIAGFGQSEDNNRQSRTVSGFHGVEISGGIDLYLSNGPEYVAISASGNNLRDHIKTEVENGILRIYLDQNMNHSLGNSRMKAYVSLPTLKSLGASGGQ